MPFHPHPGYAVALLAIGLAAACSRDTPTGVTIDPVGDHTPKIDVCHHSGASANIVSVSVNSLPAHLAHGDYVTTLYVSHASDSPVDDWHFRRIGDALKAVRAVRVAGNELVNAACRITVMVSDGVYEGTVTGDSSGDIEQFPLIVDVPDVSLHGVFEMELDSDGRATGDTDPYGGETTLQPMEPLPTIGGAPIPIILANAHPDGSAGNGLTVEGFVFHSGHDPDMDFGGQAVLSLRATGLVFRGNRFEGGFDQTLDLRAGDAEVQGNSFWGTADCDICLSGPGNFTATDNRVRAGGIAGIILSGAVNLPVPPGIEPFESPATAETRFSVSNNEVDDHTMVPVGTGIRVDAVGVGAPNVYNTIHADVLENQLTNDRFGVIVHAGFPVAGTALRSDVDVTLYGNHSLRTCEASLLVSFSRHQAALGLKTLPALVNSTFRVVLAGDQSWNDAWYSNPAGLGNTLIVDGTTIPSGTRQFYDPSGCPAL